MAQLPEPQPGTLEYAQKVQDEMTARKVGETPAEAARRHYYAGVDDDGIPCD